MKLAVIAFTQAGASLAGKIAGAEKSCVSFAPEQYAGGNTTPLKGTLIEWTRDAFEKYDGIIFVGACGIAVRAIAPYIKSKLTDPAIVVVDDQAQFVISLLSGHVGGANNLAQDVADAIGAQVVITTATDANHVFAVDSWAIQNNMVICNPEHIKHISGALLDGRRVGLQTKFGISGDLPDGITLTEEKPECGVCISLDTRERPFEKTLLLSPAILHLGIGCRKGVDERQIGQAVQSIIEQNGLTMQAVIDVASIDLKAQEPGLVSFCKTHGKPFRTYDAERLATVEKSINSSDFVKEVTGVDNVCERAALASAGRDAVLVVPKQAIGPVTVAVAAERWNVPFDTAP